MGQPGGHRYTTPVRKEPLNAARRFGATLLALLLGAGGCATPVRVDDPMTALRTVDTGPRVQVAAMVELDQTPDDPAYREALARAVWLPGYTVTTREAAVERLREYDLDLLKLTLRRQLPRMTAFQGLTMLCEVIAEADWTDLSPALVSSWARPVLDIDDAERPEYLALVAMHGRDNVPDVVFAMMIESNKPSQQGLRTRCWTLLTRLGYRERLIELLEVDEPAPGDAFLTDLRAGATDFGIVPRNREEILWLRKLRQADRRAFWDEATTALAQLDPDRRAALELRDIPIVVAAARHEPWLLTVSDDELYEIVAARLRDRKHYSHGSQFDNMNANRRERIYDWRAELTWGDLAAMTLALEALAVPQVVAHLFDYAARDREDKSTEYGGVLALDARGRYEIIEFVPRIRQHDQRFNASQEMLDAAYTSLFHFHFHVQRVRNDQYAGPGFGDVNYADNTRANCLVLTSVGAERMNVDFYRHGRVTVDLGVIDQRASADRPPSGRVSVP